MKLTIVILFILIAAPAVSCGVGVHLPSGLLPAICTGCFSYSEIRNQKSEIISDFDAPHRDCLRFPEDADGKQAPWSRRIADAFLARHPGAVTSDSFMTATKWNYEQGVMLVALTKMWSATGDKKYFDFVRGNLDRYIDSTGAIKTYKQSDYKLDDLCGGRAVLAVYNETNLPRYKAAADLLRKQLKGQPRTSEGGFWHKKIYPSQVWLDGLYMAGPFYGKYAAVAGEPAAFDDLVNQFLLVAKHTNDHNTGLYFHGWDESKKERWADPQTGCSPSLWGRSIGWYLMGLVDVLDDLPANHPHRQELLDNFRNCADALMKYQDGKTHLWYLVLDQGTREGNYLEASASAMFAYAFAKGANKGYLPQQYFSIANTVFQGLIQYNVTVTADGSLDLHGTCAGAGLGGAPYRDGSFSYYCSEKQRTNDFKGLGPLLMAAIEIEKYRGKWKKGF